MKRVSTIGHDPVRQLILRCCTRVVMALYGSGARGNDLFWAALNRMMYSHATRRGIRLVGQSMMIVTHIPGGQRVRTHVSRVGVISGTDWKRFWHGAADRDDW